jgi:hypothetical protein
MTEVLCFYLIILNNKKNTEKAKKIFWFENRNHGKKTKKGLSREYHYFLLANGYVSHFSSKKMQGN